MTVLDSKGEETSSDGVVSIDERKRQKILRQNCTIGEASEIAEQHSRAAMNHLGNQIGPYVTKVVSDAIKGYHESLIARGIVPPEGMLGTLTEKAAEKLAEHTASLSADDPETVQ